MAGIEKSGFDNSKGSLFKSASMILTPDPYTDLEVVENVKRFFLEIGFGSIKLTTPEIHDRTIAYTSQLAHVLSSAYIKSPAAQHHRGMSAGSFRDMTRVATLNEDMWTQLFLINRDNLISEIDALAARLLEYSTALKQSDADTLKALLRDGAEKKAEITRED
jgi:prephenate dehydrogenase